MANEKIYKDLDLSFDINPLTGDIGKKVGIDAIRQSLRNIVQYKIFEKPYNATFDVGVKSLLFENKSIGFQTFLEKRIRTLIESYEPRVIINDVLVKSGNNDNAIKITVYFTPRETQTQDSLELFLGKYNAR